MLKKRVPKRLWDFGLAWICEIGNVKINSSRYTDVCTTLKIITGCTLDIMEYLEFEFYDWVVSKQNAGVDVHELGRWLGVSHQIGQLMTNWILPTSRIPISCGTVQRLTVLEKQTAESKTRINAFEEGLEQKFNANFAEIIAPQLNKLSDINSETILDLESEDRDFLISFEQVINDA